MWIDHISCVHSSVVGHWGCFDFLAKEWYCCQHLCTVCSNACIQFFKVYTRSGIAKSHGNSVFHSLRKASLFSTANIPFDTRIIGFELWSGITEFLLSARVSC